MIDDLTPVMLLSTQSETGQALRSPLFAALKLTPAFVTRLMTLADLYRQHHIEQLQVRQLDPPIYWSIEAADAAGLELDTVWFASGEHQWGQLLGTPIVNGRRQWAEQRVLAYTCVIDVGELAAQARHGYAIDLRDDPEWEEQMGQPFADAVRRYLVQRGIWPAHWEEEWPAADGELDD